MEIRPGKQRRRKGRAAESARIHGECVVWRARCSRRAGRGELSSAGVRRQRFAWGLNRMQAGTESEIGPFSRLISGFLPFHDGAAARNCGKRPCRGVRAESARLRAREALVSRAQLPGASEAFGDCRRWLLRSPRGARDVTGTDSGTGKRRTRQRRSAAGSANRFVPVWTRRNSQSITLLSLPAINLQPARRAKREPEEELWTFSGRASWSGWAGASAALSAGPRA